MKSLGVLMGFVMSFLLPGCLSSRSGLVLDSVGPAPGNTTTAGSYDTLLVFSAFATSLRLSDVDPYRRHCTDYTLFADDGKLVRTGPNDSETMLEGPVLVELPAGSYRIVARANGYGSVTVPVVIMTQRATTVHLEGGASWPDLVAISHSNPVRLPDGQIIDWRADYPLPLHVGPSHIEAPDPSLRLQGAEIKASDFQLLKNCNTRTGILFNQVWSVLLKRAQWMRPTVERNNSQQKEQL
ncbi:MAG: hypothetical protein V9H26_06065 [Verrucomicrobiota bacterium]